MPRVGAVMEEQLQGVEPQHTLRRARELMQRLDVTALPVCSGSQLLGVIEERDIVRAALPTDEACVSDAMSGELLYCTPEQDAGDVLALMRDKQVQRLPVLDAASGQLVGMVALDDLMQPPAQPVGAPPNTVLQPD